MGKRELIALLNLFIWCLVMVERLFLAVPRGCLQFVIVVFPDHTHLLFLLLREQFINASQTDLALFLKEWKQSNISEMAELDEHYLEANTNVCMTQDKLNGMQI